MRLVSKLDLRLTLTPLIIMFNYSIFIQEQTQKALFNKKTLNADILTRVYECSM